MEDRRLVEVTERLPGTDAFRSMLLMIFGSIFAIFFALAPTALPEWLKVFSIMSNVIAALLAGMALVHGTTLAGASVLELRGPFYLFVPKLLANSAAATFLLFLSASVITFGGVLTSPFASLLALSQVYYLFEVLERRDSRTYETILRRLRDACPDFSAAVTTWRSSYLRIVRLPEYVGLCLVTGTLLFAGPPLKVTVDLHWFPAGWLVQDPVRSHLWYFTTAYVTFYVGVFSALYAVLPQEIRKDLRRRLSGT